MNPVSLLVIAPPSFEPLEVLRREAPDVRFHAGTAPGELRSFAQNADAVLVAPRYGEVLAELWPDLRNVRWIHALAAGVEFLPYDLLRTGSAIVTNSRGLYADALGEFVIGAMLWFAKDFRRLVRNQEAHRWEPYTVTRLEGQTAGIIGYGAIGRAIARRCEALGMRVVACRRRRQAGDPAIDEVIAAADYLVMSTPKTPATIGLMSRDRIAMMKRSAVFINVGRGVCVDEVALVEALRDRRIRGAALDVFSVEPLPEGHPLWSMDNVLLSPHTADHTADSHLRAMRFYLENLRRYRAGETLHNIVDVEEQY